MTELRRNCPQLYDTGESRVPVSLLVVVTFTVADCDSQLATSKLLWNTNIQMWTQRCAAKEILLTFPRPRRRAVAAVCGLCISDDDMWLVILTNARDLRPLISNHVASAVPPRALCLFFFVVLGRPDRWGGWLCFIVAIIWIGVLTAVIGDVASAFGCSVGLKDSVTAIAFVALGTSVPGRWQMALIQPPA